MLGGGGSGGGRMWTADFGGVIRCFFMVFFGLEWSFSVGLVVVRVGSSFGKSSGS